MARSIAHCFDVVLIERVPSPAARASTPTASTPGSPSSVLRSVCVALATCPSQPAGAWRVRVIQSTAQRQTWAMSVPVAEGLSLAVVVAHPDDDAYGMAGMVALH